MTNLKEKLAEKIEQWRPRITRLLMEHGDRKLGEVTIGQAIGGARSVKCLITDISYLDPNEGIRFRDYTISEVMAKLPKHPEAEIPYVEGLIYLLLTGDIPTPEEVEDVTEELRNRQYVPQYVFDILRAMPRDGHPMTMFSAAVLSMQRESVFVQRYNEGLSKSDYWESTYEDALNLIAKLPRIASYIFRMKYRSDMIIPPRHELDLGGASLT